MPIDGSSSSRSRGRASSAHLLLAARHRPRLLALPFLEAGKQREDLLEVGRDLRAPP